MQCALKESQCILKWPGFSDPDWKRFLCNIGSPGVSWSNGKLVGGGGEGEMINLSVS